MEWCYAKLGTGQPASLSHYIWRGRQKERRLMTGKRGTGLQNEQTIAVTRRFSKFKVNTGFYFFFNIHGTVHRSMTNSNNQRDAA